MMLMLMLTVDCGVDLFVEFYYRERLWFVCMLRLVVCSYFEFDFIRMLSVIVRDHIRKCASR